MAFQKILWIERVVEDGIDKIFISFPDSKVRIFTDLHSCVEIPTIPAELQVGIAISKVSINLEKKTIVFKTANDKIIEIKINRGNCLDRTEVTISQSKFWNFSFCVFKDNMQCCED